MRLLLEESHIQRNRGGDQASTTYQKVREEGPKLSHIEDMVKGQRVGYLQRAQARSPLNSSCQHVGNPQRVVTRNPLYGSYIVHLPMTAPPSQQ